MSQSVVVFLVVRVVHMLMAATWLGATVFITFFLLPVVRESGPAGGQLMSGLGRRGLNAFMATLGGTTVLTGLWLYWRLTNGFTAAVAGSPTGIAFGLGGVFGLAAAIVGGAVVGRSTDRLQALAAQVPAAKTPEEREALLKEVAVLRGRAGSGAKIVLFSIAIAFVLMTLGHYA